MTLTGNAVVKAKAFKSGSNPSAEASASFIVSQPQLAGTGVTRYADGQLSSNCTSGNYSIAKRDCTGKDGNAYKSLQDASNASAPGDTILVRSFSGVYTGSGGTCPGCLNDGASYVGQVIPRSGNSSSSTPGTRCTTGCSNIWGYGSEIPVVQGLASAQYVYVKNIKFDGAAAAAGAYGVANITFSRFENVEISNHGGHGMGWSEDSDWINLHLHHNGFRADPLVDCGYKCHGMYFNRGLIDGGEIHNNRGYGIHCYSKCQNTTIRNTRVHHNGGAGILVASNPGNLIHNVVADNNGGFGIWLAASGAVADNNTTYNNGGLGICVDSTNITVTDNIALDGLATSCNSGAFSFTSSNNLTSGSASMFIDAANGNFQLKPTSTLQGVGANLSSLSY
jgi:hypothetical protein